MTDETASLRRDWRRFAAAVFLFGFGFAIYNGVFQNFLKGSLGADELDLGRLESFREVPGLLTALTMTTLVAFAESRLAAVGLAITAVGIGLSGLTSTIPAAIALSVFWSVGFHLYATMQGPITLTLAKGLEGGRHLGRMQGVSALATIAGLGLAWAMSHAMPKAVYEPYFAVAGALILGAAVSLGRLSHHAAGGPRQRWIVRREYGLFYLLTFLEGCRRQIFSIFATFTLIAVYRMPVDRMLALQLVNSILIAVTAPRIGRIVDARGERGPLIFYAVGLILVFAGYAVSRSLAVLIVLYLLDNVLFSFSFGISTYLQRIVRPGELTPCSAMGITMNHVAAVTVPLGGALLWRGTGDYRTPFVVGVVIACVSLATTLRLPKGPRVASGN